MSRAMPPFSQYAFMAWCSVKESMGTTLPLPLNDTIRRTLISEASKDI